MRKLGLSLLVLTSLLTIPASLNAGGNAFPANGSVGIGTPSPTIDIKLHLYSDWDNGASAWVNSLHAWDVAGGSFYLSFFRQDYGQGKANDVLFQSSTGNLLFCPSHAAKDIKFFGGAWGNAPSMVIKDGGNVGIGTTNPNQQLQVNYSGDNNVASFWGTSSGFYMQSQPSYMALYSYASNGVSRDMSISATGGPIISQIYLKTSGYVGIGTTNPSAPLEVNGMIKAREIRVTIADANEFKVNNAKWSDFVFDKGYKLPSLDHVESYIKENKHLPDVPSAEEIKKDGLAMADMMAKQMQKIEELTLYVIELKRENEKLAKINSDQQTRSYQEIAELKAKIESLENRIH